MELSNLSPAKNSYKKKKRVGRGPGSGMGKTSTRGHKGLNSRAGGGVSPGFEGGQMPIHRRLPKRGFTNIFKKNIVILNIRDLNVFEEGSNINIEALRKARIIKGHFDNVKILGNGDITKSLSIQQCLVSKTAKEKIEAAGGSIKQDIFE